MSNQFRNKAFLTIKHNIRKCTNYGQLESCQRMLENAYSILTRDEITILKEYLDSANTLLRPLNYETELLTVYNRLGL